MGTGRTRRRRVRAAVFVAVIAVLAMLATAGYFGASTSHGGLGPAGVSAPPG